MNVKILVVLVLVMMVMTIMVKTPRLSVTLTSFNSALPPSQQLLPLYVVETMGMVPGLSGLFVSGIFSGSLSTVSSALNSLAAVTYQDYILVGGLLGVRLFRLK